MSDLGDLDASLPSYPNLSPPSSDTLFETFPPSTGMGHYDTPTPHTSTGMGHYGISTQTTTGIGRPNDVSSGGGDDPLYENLGYPNVNQLPVSHAAVGNPSHFIASSSPSSALSPGSTTTTTSTTTDFPIYATVKKKADREDAKEMDLYSNARQRTTSGSPTTDSLARSNVPPHDHTPLSGDASVTLQLHLKHLEQLCSKLNQEKKKVEEEFGRQRKSFMNHMGHLEAQLTLCKQTVDKYGQEIRELSKQVLYKDEELNNVSIAAGITEATIRERFDEDRVKYEEEIASLRKIVSVQSQDTNQAMQQDRERWQTENASLRSELEQLKRGGMVRSPHPPSMVTTPPGGQQIRTPSPESEDANLERLMIKAAEDTKLLRSVVVPLEEEIQSLKSQLSVAMSKLAEKEEARVAETSDLSLIDFDASLSFAEQDTSRNFTSPLPSDQRELQHQLRLARSACNDLEMHTSQLNMQKSILQSELKSLSDQLAQVTTDLEVEKLNCVELKKTWQLANDHFIVAQDKLKQEIYRLHQKLERGDAVSPIREIPIEPFPSPTIVERASKHVDDISDSRTHKRSWSTDEVSEFSSESPLEIPSLDRLKSASWSSLQKPSDAISEREEVLSKKTESLESELSKAQSELLHLRKKCTNYEKQLPRVQEQLMTDLREKEAVIDKIKAENDKFRAHVMRQQQQHEALCRQVEDLKEEMKTKIETFQVNEKEYKSQLRVLRDKFTEIKQDTQREIVRMSEDRRNIYQQLEGTKEEYNILKIVQGEDMATYQAQLADMKQKLQDSESKHASLASQLSNARDQLRQVREMMTAERTNRERANAQLEMAKGRIDELSPLIARVEAERTAKEEAISSRNATEKKSRTFINEQRDIMEKLDGEKERAQTQVSELQIQVASLKHKLNHTEETQKDFVELSQSLQMKLANIEEEIQKSQESASSLSST